MFSNPRNAAAFHEVPQVRVPRNQILEQVLGKEAGRGHRYQLLALAGDRSRNRLNRY